MVHPPEGRFKLALAAIGPIRADAVGGFSAETGSGSGTAFRIDPLAEEVEAH